MDQVASGSVVFVEIAICWVLSMGVFWAVDLFARRRLGGGESVAYKALRIPRFLCMAFVSAAAIVVVLLIMLVPGFGISRSVLTYVELPFFFAWLYYLVAVFRRLRAQR